MKTNFKYLAWMVLALCSAITAMAQQKQEKECGLIAHRGLWKSGHPQNSISGIQAALKSNYAGFECDIRQTKDGVLILNHDDDFHGVDIADNNYESIRDGRQRPALLKDMLDICGEYPGKTIFAEVKGGNTDDILAAFGAAAICEGVIFKSFNKDLCLDLISKTDMPVWLLSTNSLLDFDQLKKEGFAGMSLMYEEGVTTPQLIDSLHSKGLLVAFWTVNNPEVAKQLAEWGADFVITDLPNL